MTPQQQILDHITNTIGADPTQWDQLTTYGWLGEIEAAFLDSVLLVQAQYGNSQSTGVRLRVRHWRDERVKLGGANVVLDNLSELAKFDAQPAALASILDNHQTLSGKDGQRPLKALAVAQAARLFVNNGISHASQVTGNPRGKTLWCSIDGLGPATWHYVLMLLGKPDVKADTMITRFVENALGYAPPNAAVRTLVVSAATALGVSPTDLDYAVWSWQRRQRRTRS